MAFDDDFFGRIFPTRTGQAIGSSGERKMLDAIGGSQSFRTRLNLNSDGTVTLLRTKNGMPQFQTLGEKVTIEVICYLEMDSGIVDLHEYDDSVGTIYQTTYVSEHTATSVNNKAIGCGEISSEDAKGTVVASGADSISFTSSGISAMSFSQRRALALRSPPSVYTGKTRLYVQSLLGSARSDLILSDSSDGVSRPILGVTTVARDSLGVPVVNIGSGCGVFKAPDTNKHFLLYPVGGSVYVYPLVATECAERFRGFLSDATLSEADKERIESYILAYSVPTVYATQVLTFEETTDEALGYSWHFNWDGDRCDIVDVEEVPINGIYGFRTTHFRLTFSYGAGVFSVDRSVVSGPTEWSVPKNKNVIAYPEWYFNALVKAGNIPSGIDDVPQSGVLYAFYDKNTLHTVEYSGLPAEHENTRTSTPEYYGGLKYESYFIGYLKSGESGNTKGISEWSGNTNKFSCGSASVGVENYNRYVDERSHVFRSRAAVASTPEYSWFSSTPWDIYYGEPTFSVGYDTSGTPTVSDIAWEKTSVTGQITEQGTAVAEIWDYSVHTYTETQASFTLVIIPFNDAQAVYLSGKTITSRDGDRTVSHGAVVNRGGDTVGAAGNTVYASSQVVNGATYDKYYITGLVSNATAFDSLPAVEYTDSSDVKVDDVLVCSHGNISCSPPDQEIFYSSEPYVSQVYNTLESVNGVVIAPETGVFVGGTTWPNYPSLVGWC